jgi:hypothetical protein
MYQTSTVNDLVYMCQRYRLYNQYLWHMYTWSFTVLVWYMYINNNNNKRYHRNRETIDTSYTCIHDRSLYWSGTCTLIIIIIKDIIETEKQSIPLTHVYMTVHWVQWTVMYTSVRGIHCFSDSMISFIIIIINVHVPDQYSERSCIHASEVSIVSLFLWYFLLLLLLMYMYQTSTVSGHVYMCQRYRLVLVRSLYWSSTCTLIIIIIKDIIETEKQSIPLTHVYMTVHCTGLVHVH